MDQGKKEKKEKKREKKGRTEKSKNRWTDKWKAGGMDGRMKREKEGGK